MTNDDASRISPEMLGSLFGLAAKQSRRAAVAVKRQQRQINRQGLRSAANSARNRARQPRRQTLLQVGDVPRQIGPDCASNGLVAGSPASLLASRRQRTAADARGDQQFRQQPTRNARTKVLQTQCFLKRRNYQLGDCRQTDRIMSGTHGFAPNEIVDPNSFYAAALRPFFAHCFQCWRLWNY